MPRENAEKILDIKLEKLKKTVLSKLPWLSSKPEEIQDVVFEMGYQLGISGLLSFKNTLNDQMADSVLLALSNGISSSGTDDYGTDYFYPLASGHCPVFGGYWNSGANTGLLYIHYYSWASYNNVICGARAMLVP